MKYNKSNGTSTNSAAELRKKLTDAGLTKEETVRTLCGLQGNIVLPADLQEQVDTHVRRATARLLNDAMNDVEEELQPGEVINHKYKLVVEPDAPQGLLRVVYTRDIPTHGIAAGTRGGLVAGPECLDQDGDAVVLGDARVVNPAARVRGNAIISGNAVIAGNAVIDDNAIVGGNAIVGENAHVDATAVVMGDAHVRGNARIGDCAVIGGNAIIDGNAYVGGCARVTGAAAVFGEALVYGNARIGGNARVSMDARVSGSAVIMGNAVISDGAQLGGTVIADDNARITGTTLQTGNYVGSAWIARKQHAIRLLGGTLYRSAQYRRCEWASPDGWCLPAETLAKRLNPLERAHLDLACWSINQWY